MSKPSVSEWGIKECWFLHGGGGGVGVASCLPGSGHAAPAQQQTSTLEMEPSASSGLLALCYIRRQTRGNSRGRGIRQPGLGSLCLCWDPPAVGPALSSQGGAPPAELPPPKTSQPAHVRPSVFASAPGNGPPLWLCGGVALGSLTCDCSLFSESQSSLVSNNRSFLHQASGRALHS